MAGGDERSPGPGEDDRISSSSSRARFRLAALLGPLLAADMLGRSGVLGGVNGSYRTYEGRSTGALTSFCCQISAAVNDLIHYVHTDLEVYGR